MQWLIDLVAERVIATIGIPPCFIDRGDPASFDFTRITFIRDAGWHDLDLSGIVAVNAQTVLIQARLRSSSIGKVLYLRKKGNVNFNNVCLISTQVANAFMQQDLVCPCDADRKCQYLLSAEPWTNIDVTIKGWWL